MKNRDWDTLVRNVFVAACILVALFAILGERFLPSENLFYVKSADVYDGKWERILEDGATVPVEVPGKVDAKKGEVVRLRTVLPEDLKDDMIMSFLSVYQVMDFYVDGEHRMTYDDKDEVFFTKYPSRAYVPLSLSSEDAGKELVVETYRDYDKKSFNLYTVYIGHMHNVMFSIARMHMLKVIVAFTMMMVSFIVGLVCMVLGKMTGRKISMVWLCIAVSLIMAWVVADSRVRQFMMPNVSVVASTAYYIAMLVPIAFVIYMDDVQKLRYRREYLVLKFLTFGLLAGCCIANLLGVDFVDMSNLVYFVLFVVIVICTKNLIKDTINGHIKEYKFVAIGIGVAFLGCLSEIIMLVFEIGDYRQYLLCASLIVVVILAAFQSMTDIRNSIEYEKRRAEVADKSRRELLGSMSSELLPLMRDLEDEILNSQRELGAEKVSKLHTEVTTALSFLASIRDVSNMRKDPTYENNTVYDLGSVMERVRAYLDVRAKNCGLEAQFIMGEDLPTHLMGNVPVNKHVYISLIELAVQHTKSGYVALGFFKEIREDGRFYLKISVADSGDGIPERTVRQLHEGEELDAYGGDLRIVSVRQSVVEQGGSFYIESVEGAGSIITVMIPQIVVEEDEKKEAVESSELMPELELMGEEPTVPAPSRSRTVIDEEEGIRYCGADRGLYGDVLVEYRAMGDKYLKQLPEFFASHDWENYKIIVHAIKSSSLNIGAKEASMKAKGHEMAAKESDGEFIEKDWDEFLAVYKDTLAQVDDLIVKYKGKNVAVKKESPLESIRKAVQDFDVEAALSEVERLTSEGYENPELLSRVKEALEEFDYDAAEEALRGEIE